MGESGFLTPTASKLIEAGDLADRLSAVEAAVGPKAHSEDDAAFPEDGR
jgi:hypothetical protein